MVLDHAQPAQAPLELLDHLDHLDRAVGNSSTGILHPEVLDLRVLLSDVHLVLSPGSPFERAQQ